MKICVFCSSSNQIDKIYFDKSREILSLFARNDFDLIYGGSDLGLMGEIAKLFKENNRKVTGIIPERLNEMAGRSSFVDESLVVKTMHERKLLMRNFADCFLALPGGFGTLEELMEVVTLKQLGYIDKPIVIVNINGFYDRLISHFDFIIESGFAKKKDRNLFFISDNGIEIYNYVLSNLKI